jgi:hypothetical protein
MLVRLNFCQTYMVRFFMRQTLYWQDKIWVKFYPTFLETSRFITNKFQSESEAAAWPKGFERHSRGPRPIQTSGPREKLHEGQIKRGGGNGGDPVRSPQR